MGLYTDKRKITHTHDGYELLTHESGHLEYDFAWHLGLYWSKLYNEILKNKRWMAIKCSQCGKVYMPPRELCSECFSPMNEWVEVGPEGVCEGFTVVRFPYIDANTGGMKQVPFTCVWVVLDGADTRMTHVCSEIDETKLHVGGRMRMVWNDSWDGTSTLQNCGYFEPIE